MQVSQKIIHRLRQNKLYKSWLVSYFIILLLPLMINLVVFFQAENSIKQENQYSQYTTLTRFCSSVDSQLAIVGNFAAKISNDSSLLYFLEASGMSDYLGSFEKSQKASALTSLLKQCEPLNSVISDYYLFSLTNDLVWHNSGLHDRQAYSGSLYYSNMTSSIVSEMEDHELDQTFFLSLNNSELAIVYPLPSSYHPEGYMIVLLDPDFMASLIDQLAAPYQSRLYILDSEDSILYQSASAEEHPVDLSVLSGTDSSAFVDDAYVYRLDSDILPVHYMSVSPLIPDTSDLHYLRLTMLISLIFCLIGGGIMILLFSHRNYSPVKKLVDTVRERSDLLEQECSDEYQFVSDALKDIYAKHSSVKEIVNRQNKTLYAYYLSSLMRGRIPAWSVDDGTADTMEQELLLEAYVVLVIMTDFSEDFLSSHPEILESAYAAFSETQFLEQLSSNLGRRYLVSSTQVNDLTACVVSIPADKTDAWQNDLRDALLPITAHFEKEFHCKNYYSCSSIHHGITELSASYTEASDLMSFAVMNSDSGDILFPEDILLMNSQNSLPVSNLEQTITNYVLTAQTQELSLFITDTLNRYASESLPFHTIKGLACGIVLMIQRGLEQLPQGETETAQKQEFYQILSSVVKETSYDRLKDFLLKAVSKACELSAASSLHKKNSLVDRIEAELSKNLYNENLNIMFLSGQLGLNAKYLSAAYQEATGNNLMNVIHQRRIKRFKELLAEENCSIKEAAQKVGYSNVVTLNRWFKKFEGVTPGKIKALQKH